MPNAETLLKGNDVRIGGVRVGFVESVEPEQNQQTGAVHAKADLKLDKNVDPLPKDSTVIVRAKSALGLKYLEIDKGTSDQGYPEGSILPLSAAHPHPVEIDQVLNTFDPATRQAIQANLVGFGDALAGRGPDLNAALGELQPLVTRARARGAEPGLFEDGPRALLQGAQRPRHRRWRRWPRPRRSCS